MLDHIASSSGAKPSGGPNKKWTLDQKVKQGERNTTAASYIGRLLRKADESDWDTKVWKKVVKWNAEYCVPPLEEEELKTVFESIANTELERRESEGPDSDSGNQATEIFNQIMKMPDLVLFLDEFDEPYMRYRVKDHLEVSSCGSKACKLWIAFEAKRILGKIPETSKVESVCKMLQAQAYHQEITYKLSNRSAMSGSNIYYDLANKSWQVIEVTSNGWSLIETPRILFRRFKQQDEQVVPVHGGRVADVLNYVNITDDDQKILFLVWLVCSFIPNFPHPIMYVYGPQGSAKSTISWVIRMLVDPSKLEVGIMPRDHKEINQILAHNHLIFFDNISYLSDETSDLLCRGVTGAGISKRQLYTDNEDVIYNIQAKIGLNGINMVVDRPDLMERCILFELDRVPSENYKEERKLKAEFEAQRPAILGAIFGALSAVLRIYPTVPITKLPRMADFVVYGCAVAEALGYKQEEFLDAYRRSMDSQNNAILEDNIEAILILQLMSDRAEWSGNATELLVALREILGSENVKESGFSTRHNQLSGKVNRLKIPLESAGIHIERRKGKGKVIVLTNRRFMGTGPIDMQPKEGIGVVPVETLLDGSDGFDESTHSEESMDGYDWDSIQ